MIKPTIVELCLSPDLGGLELSMINAAKLLKDDFDVLSVVKKDSKISKYYGDDESCIELEKKSFFSLFSEARKLAKIVDSNGVKLIHIHWSKDLTFVVLAKLFSKSKPKIVQSRHMTMTRFKDDFYHKFIYKNIDLMIAVTKQVKEQLEKFIPDEVRPEIELLYSGAKEQKLLSDSEVEILKDKLGFSKSSFNIGMVGRINEAKGQHLLIKAVEILVAKGLDVNAYFVGHAMEESYLEKLKNMVKQNQLENHIHFLGFMKNPHNFYQICDAVVLASKKETFGLVLIEAMQMGTAVIGSNSGGVVEIIEDEKNGLLFENENEKDLANKIEFMMDNSEKLKQMKQEASLKCTEYFNEKIQYEKLKTIFKKLI